MLSRREMIQLFLASLAASATTACGQNFAKSISEMEQNKVFVIGAGIAGLKAARDLKAAGFDVTVLEARDRLGGRTWTDSTLGKPIDLGASWIHGSRGNPISALANQLETPLYEWDYENAQLTNLSRENGPILETLLQQAERGLYRAFDQLDETDNNVTVADVVNALRQTETFKGFNQQEVDFAIQMVVELNEAADAPGISALGANEGKVYAGPDMVLREGYRILVDHLAEGLNIHLSEPVTEIDYGGARAVIGTRKDAYMADYVVVTAPLGVLKQNKIRFYPEFPAQKKAAIDGLEMGLLNKVYLRFEAPFWDADLNSFLRVPESGMRWSNWSSLSGVHDAPILFALNSGAAAKALEGLSDAEIIADAIASLRSIFGDEVPEPSDYVITRWGQDPFAYGSYAHVKPGSDTSVRQDLAVPLRNLLFFAGEATSARYPGTVHGAFTSAETTATWIVNLASAQIAAREKAAAKDKDEAPKSDAKKDAKKDDGH